MQFVLIPFALCFLLYIRQENQYRFRAATALKITLTMTLTLCLAVALARRFSPVLLTAAVGMLLCAGGAFPGHSSQGDRTVEYLCQRPMADHLHRAGGDYGGQEPVHRHCADRDYRRDPVGSGRIAVLPVGHGAGDLELSKAPHPAGGPELAAVFCWAIYAVRRIYRGGPIKNAPTSVSDVGAIWGMMGVMPRPWQRPPARSNPPWWRRSG